MSSGTNRAQLLQLINSYMISQSLKVVAELGIADKLESGPKTLDELAGSAVVPAALYRVLRALCSIGVFAENDDRFEQTPLSELLRRDVAGSVWSAAMMMPFEFSHAFDRLPIALATEEDAFAAANGSAGWQYMSEHADRGAIFDEMMQAFHGDETTAFIEAYDFSATRLVVDIGGGNGDVVSQILANHKHLEAVLFDRPDVAERTSRQVSGRANFDRCRFEGGDFFDKVPAGGDLYILRHIIHDWSDQESISILKSCRNAIQAQGRLLIVEGLIEPGNEPSSFKWLDLVMMLCWGGRERTRLEYAAVVEQAGFRLNRVIPTTTEVSILECVTDVATPVP